MRTAVGGLRDLHRRAALCFAAVLAGYAVALVVIANDARTHAIGIGTLAILLPMLAVTMTTGSVNYDDITLAWTLAGLPDVDRLESDLAARDLPGAQPVAGRPRRSVRLESAVSTWNWSPAPPPRSSG
jgi:ATP-binding cassette subfamily B protein